MPNSSPDYYERLQVARDATQADIKRAFRRLARQHHPDLNPHNPEAAIAFRQICEAYEVLGDPIQRRRYDHPDQAFAAPGASAATATNPYKFYRQGIQSLTARRYAEALNHFSRAIRLNPKFEKAYLKRIQVRYVLADDRGVLEDCQRVLQLNPQLVSAFYYRGLARDRLGYTQSAIESYTDAIALDAKHAQAHYHRGLAHRDLGELEQAIADFQQAAALFEAQEDRSGYELAQKALRKASPIRSLGKTLVTGLSTLRLAAGLIPSLLMNPAGALLPAYARFKPGQAAAVGLFFAAIAMLIAQTGVSLGQPNFLISRESILGMGLMIFVSLAATSAIARLIFQRGSWTGDLFLAGAALLPLGILVLLSVLLWPWGSSLVGGLAIVAICHEVLMLYSGCTQIHHFTESVAAWIVSVMLLVSSYGTYRMAFGLF